MQLLCAYCFDMHYFVHTIFLEHITAEAYNTKECTMLDY